MLAPKKETTGPIWSALKGTRATQGTQRSQLVDVSVRFLSLIVLPLNEPKSQMKRLSELGLWNQTLQVLSGYGKRRGAEFQEKRANSSTNPHSCPAHFGTGHIGTFSKEPNPTDN